MKLLLVFLFVAAAAAQMDEEIVFPRFERPPPEAPNSRAALPTWRTITQRQNNFDPMNVNRWIMRYLENGQFFTADSPIFIMLGGEEAIDTPLLRNGQMFDMAAIHHAQMFYTEHRYYGPNYPTPDLTVPNLKFFTVDQALADVANFIVTMKANNPNFANSKVVVFGCSYAGVLANWMRQKYPHLVHAAVSSSAPILAQADYQGYYDVIRDALGSKCSSIVMNASKEILRLISTGNIAKVKTDFNVCYPLINNHYIQIFFINLAGIFTTGFQYAPPDRVTEICNKLENADTRSDYYRLVNYFPATSCPYNYNSSIHYLTNTSPYAVPSYQWLYQTCTGLGYFITSWADTALFNFGISADYYIKQCTKLYGQTITGTVVTNSIAATNREHGGLKPAATRVISIHGGNDPWRAAGLPASDNPSLPTYVVPLASHCKDIGPLNSSNISKEMREAKQAVVKYIAAWLNEP